MDLRLNLLVMLIYIVFGAILAYACLFRQEILEAIYPDRVRKAKKKASALWLAHTQQRATIRSLSGDGADLCHDDPCCPL